MFEPFDYVFVFSFFFFFLINGVRQPSNPSIEMLFISLCFFWKNLCLVVEGEKMAKGTEQEMCGC